MKKILLYSLVGILMGAILGVGLSSLSDSFKPEDPFLPVPRDSQKRKTPQKKKISEKRKTSPGGRILTSPDQQNYPAAKEGVHHPRLTLEDIRKIQMLEENFLGGLVGAFDRIVEKKDATLINPTMAVFLRKAPTAMCRLETLKCWKRLENLSDNWPPFGTNKREAPK